MVLTKMKCGKIGILLIQKILKIGLCCERREGGGGSKCRAAAPGGRAQRAPGGRVGRRADSRAERRRAWEAVALRCDGLDFPPPYSQSLPRIRIVSGHLLATRLRLGPNREFSLILAREEETTFSPQPYGICNL